MAIAPHRMTSGSDELSGHDTKSKPAVITSDCDVARQAADLFPEGLRHVTSQRRAQARDRSRCWSAAARERRASDRRGRRLQSVDRRRHARVPFCTADEVDRAVAAAADALPAWAETPVVERARVHVPVSRADAGQRSTSWRALVTREHGKTLAESRAEMQRGIEMVEFACGIPSLLMGQTLREHRPRTSTARRAGIRSASASGITPFNFPSMVPLWMFPVAITCIGAIRAPAIELNASSGSEGAAFDSDSLRLPFPLALVAFFFGSGLAVFEDAFFFACTRASVSASHAAFSLPCDAGRLLAHWAECSSPPISAIVRLVRTDVS